MSTGSAIATAATTGYLGRVVAIGRTPGGAAAVLYRVSSRSFPDRTASRTPTGATILPRVGHQADLSRSSFIAYDCLDMAGARAVVSNGSHTGILADKLAAAHSMRDALMTVLAVMDYERDSVGTPRIAGIVDAEKAEGYLGIVTPRALQVGPVALIPGGLSYLATSAPDPTRPGRDDGFVAETATGACRHILTGGMWAEVAHPVAAAAALWRDGAWEVAVADAPAP